VTGENAVGNGSSRGPVCPHCREPLRGNLRQEHLTPRETTGPGPGLAMTLTYCGPCGWTLHLTPAVTGVPAGPGLVPEEVAAPADEQTLEGQFQLRCRELIGEIRSLGFNPNVWVAMINSLGAVGAAKKLLADHHVLVATPWLVRRDRPDLTLEHAIGQPRWAGLFTDEERAEAARRLARAGKAPRRRRRWLRARGAPKRSGFLPAAGPGRPVAWPAANGTSHTTPSCGPARLRVRPVRRGRRCPAWPRCGTGAP
jgi:hypothetical protein